MVILILLGIISVAANIIGIRVIIFHGLKEVVTDLETCEEWRS